MSLKKSIEHIHLTSEKVSLVLSIIDNQVAVTYWGAPLKVIKDKPTELVINDSFQFNNLDAPINCGFWRENSRGWPGTPGLSGHRNGEFFSTRLEIQSITHHQQTAEFVSADNSAEITTKVTFTLDESGILLVDNEIMNIGSTPYSLNSLGTWLPIPDQAKELLSFSGRWLKERQMQRFEIPIGVFSRESRDGRSGHDGTIALLALSQDANFQFGEVWSCALAWSGNTKHQFEKLTTGFQSLGAEELLLPGEVILQSNETYKAPTTIFGYSNNGIDAITHKHHEWLRSRKSHPTKVKPRPLTLNVWEAVYFDHDLAKLTKLADVAEKIGVERFVLDDGWFNLRRDDHAGLGDWWVDQKVWPKGLGELIEVVKSKGMEFGLWFEPEMVNPDSELYRSHPDWILKVGTRFPPAERNQQVLNLANPEVFEYIFSKMNALLTEYAIDYIKWDHNRVLIEPGFLNRAIVNEQTQSYYRLIAALKKSHPRLEIESCASGGARIDLGVARLVDRFWVSDCNEALERTFIQRWTGLVIPPEMLGTHIGPPKSHTTGRVHNLSFRAVTALFGHAGIEWDVTQASTVEQLLLADWISYYKTNRDLLHSGDVVRVNQPDQAIWVHGVVSQNQDKAIFSVSSIAAIAASKPPLLKFFGLNPNYNYFVRIVQPAGPAETIKNEDPSWAKGAILGGDLILNHGLRGLKIQPENAYLVEMIRQD